MRLRAHPVVPAHKGSFGMNQGVMVQILQPMERLGSINQGRRAHGNNDFFWEKHAYGARPGQLGAITDINIEFWHLINSAVRGVETHIYVWLDRTETRQPWHQPL